MQRNTSSCKLDTERSSLSPHMHSSCCTRRTRLAGQAISTSADTASYERLFKSFVKMRKGVVPRVGFTDRALAVKAAWPAALPGCHHLICEFHLAQNLRENLGKLGDGFQVSRLSSDSTYRTRPSTDSLDLLVGLRFIGLHECMLCKPVSEDISRRSVQLLTVQVRRHFLTQRVIVIATLQLTFIWAPQHELTFR